MGGAGDAGATMTDPSQATDVLERRFAPEGEAQGLTGAIGWGETYRLGGEDGAGETVLTLVGENGLRLEARLIGPIAVDAAVADQPIGNLMDLGEGAEPAHYGVISQTGGQLCGASVPTDVVAYETSGSPPETLTLLVTTGGAPGAGGAQLCQVLRYIRAGG